MDNNTNKKFVIELSYKDLALISLSLNYYKDSKEDEINGEVSERYNSLMSLIECNMVTFETDPEPLTVQHLLCETVSQLRKTKSYNLSGGEFEGVGGIDEDECEDGEWIKREDLEETINWVKTQISSLKAFE